MDSKQKKQEIINYLLSERSSQIEKDTIKVLWGRIPPPYGVKVYTKQTTINFN